MIRRRALVILLCAALPSAAAAREAIAVFADWGAFRDTGPARCFAIAEPPPGTTAQGRGAYVTVASWPDRRIRAQLAVRLSRGHLAGAPVTLTIGEGAFRLVADARTAWGRDRSMDARIVAAMRSGSSMSIATVSPLRHAYADVYRLRGAASAIDAAMLACPLRR